jgi:hypothetical protein
VISKSRSEPTARSGSVEAISDSIDMVWLDMLMIASSRNGARASPNPRGGVRHCSARIVPAAGRPTVMRNDQHFQHALDPEAVQTGCVQHRLMNDYSADWPSGTVAMLGHATTTSNSLPRSRRPRSHGLEIRPSPVFLWVR